MGPCRLRETSLPTSRAISCDLVRSRAISCDLASSPGGMKYSISICSNSRERKMKLRGVISLRNALPICAMPKGT